MHVRCAAIVAGGASRRMGRPKALLPLEGQPLIARTATTLRPLFPEIVVVTASAEIAHAAALPTIADVFPGRGPLAGIHAALRHFARPVFCVACDMPFLNAALIAHLATSLEDYDALVPRVGGYAEPLHAVYAPACLPVLEAALQAERPAPIETVLRPLRVRWIEEDEARRFDPTLRCFENWNRPEDVSGV